MGEKCKFISDEDKLIHDTLGMIEPTDFDTELEKFVLSYRNTGKIKSKYITQIEMRNRPNEPVEVELTIRMLM